MKKTIKDKHFEKGGGYFAWDKTSSVKEFDRNKLLSGKHRRK